MSAHRGTHRVLAVTVAALLVAGCAALAGPGKGPRAREGYESASPIISALYYYHANQREYPETLDDLVPDYLATEDLLVATVRNQKQPFAYVRIADEYELSFAYAGSGNTLCHYRPSTEWQCRND